MKVTLILVKLLFLGALFIISNHNLHLNDHAEREVFLEMYYNWIDNLFDQGIQVTSYVVKFEWLPNNKSYVEKNGFG